MKTKKVYSSIIKGLNEAIDYEKGKSVPGIKRKKISIMPIPQFNSSKIKEIRNKLKLSQSTLLLLLEFQLKQWRHGNPVAIFLKVLRNVFCGSWKKIIIY